ncbi:MAG: T9SS type A sorting domain-containing protein [Flavobacteriales bacterium]|nr:T9SS type A sorting domain-containing protein [Flavobacteriales bacterium]MBP9160852.1 T9SS type A sorting domain-containing protein [Flavobacteriales bacterium]
MHYKAALRLFWIGCIMHGAGFPHHAYAQQGINNLWMGGFEDESPPPWGGSNLNYQTGNLLITTTDWHIDFFRTNTNITNSEGDLLFSTNGAFIANVTGDTMQNGSGLNPSLYATWYPEGLNISQGCLIIPKPEEPNIYYLFHATIDDIPNSVAHHLYLTEVNSALDNGTGEVESKNVEIIADTLNGGRITAVRHANGRDWWIFCFKANSNMHYRLLVTPNGVQLDGNQAIGEIRTPDHGQACFSPDGTRYAYYSGFDPADLEIFDFDRCTGLFSNPIDISIDDSNSLGGLAFSPNGRFLYVSSVLDVYQFDMEAADIAGSMLLIAHWDGYYSPAPPFSTVFDIAQLAPDGKIYIGTGNGTLHMHVINNPDEPGLACNLVQHGIVLPRYYANSLPNHPNYFLGALAGSPCDTLGLSVGLDSAGLGSALPAIVAFPNPTLGNFTLSYPAHATLGELEVRDVAGRVVLRERLPQWSTMHQVELTGQTAGMYQCKLSWGQQSTTTHLVLER